jgi:hypothetical protein
MLKQDRIDRSDRVRLHFRVAILLVCIPSGCASPGREDYAAAASYHAGQARKNDALIQQHEAAIQLLDREGDQIGVDISRKAAEEARQHRRWERFQATKDSWLSRWWLPAAIGAGRDDRATRRAEVTKVP